MPQLTRPLDLRAACDVGKNLSLLKRRASALFFVRLASFPRIIGQCSRDLVLVRAFHWDSRCPIVGSAMTADPPILQVESMTRPRFLRLAR